MRPSRPNGVPIPALPVLALLALIAPDPANAATPPDPLESVQWESHHQRYFSSGPVVFDPRVKLLAPDTVEDSMQVPVTVDARELEAVEEMVVVADYNPIPLVLRFLPQQARPYLSFRIKLQQASPIRAGVRTRDGVWHLGGKWVDAAGGGCTLPSLASGSSDWAARMGEIYGRIWPERDGERRLRLRLMHPMDTGLADGIPAFYIERLQLHTADGESVMQLLPFEPVSENPVLGFDLGADPRWRGQVLSLSGRDNNGNRFKAGLLP